MTGYSSQFLTHNSFVVWLFAPTLPSYLTIHIFLVFFTSEVLLSGDSSPQLKQYTKIECNIFYYAYDTDLPS